MPERIVVGRSVACIALSNVFVTLMLYTIRTTIDSTYTFPTTNDGMIRLGDSLSLASVQQQPAAQANTCQLLLIIPLIAMNIGLD